MFLFGFTLFEFTFVDLRHSWPTGTFGAGEKTLPDIIVCPKKWSEICWFRVLETVIYVRLFQDLFYTLYYAAEC